ncbi:MAG: ArsR/SmtB family transcription factor [Pyrinomonadaceae bacterium]
MNTAAIKPNLGEFERLFLALGDKTRLKLLTLMADEPVSVGFLVDGLGESQPKVSRHLAYLRNSGVVNTKRDGKWIYYGLNRSDDPDIAKVVDFVISTLSGKDLSSSHVSKRSRTDRGPVEDRVDVEVMEAPADLIALNEVDDVAIDDGPWSTEYIDLEDGEEEVGAEAFGEAESDRDELEVFLL